MSSNLTANQHIQNLAPYKAGLTTEEIQNQYGLKQVIKLGSNENPHGPSFKVIETLRLYSTEVAIYPDPSIHSLKSEIAKNYQILPEEVFLGNGSDEVLLMIALTFLNENTHVLVSENTFSQYECVSQIAKAKVIKIPLTPTYHYDLNGFLSQIQPQTKAIFLCNPNNPTGTHFDSNQLLDFLAKVPSHVLVVVDEAYGEYATDLQFPRSHQFLNKFSNLLVLHTFSKIFALAGLRIGYALGQSDIIRSLESCRNFNVFNVNLLAQKAVLAALSDVTYTQKMVEINAQERQMLASELELRGYRVLPSQGNFLCLYIGPRAQEWYKDLLSQGVIVRWLSSFGLPDWCRVTVGTPEQNRLFLAACSKISMYLKDI